MKYTRELWITLFCFVVGGLVVSCYLYLFWDFVLFCFSSIVFHLYPRYCQVLWGKMKKENYCSQGVYNSTYTKKITEQKYYEKSDNREICSVLW